MAYIGCKYPVYAALETETDGAAPTYSAGGFASKLIKVDYSEDRNDTKLYGDDAEIERDNSQVGGTITVGIDHLDDALRTALLGTTYLAGTSGDYLLDDQPSPYVGFGYTFNGVKGGVATYIARWFYKVQFSMASDNHSTKGERTEFSTVELTGHVMAVRPAAGKCGFGVQQTFTTEAAALAWLKTKAGIVTTTTTSGT